MIELAIGAVITSLVKTAPQWLPPIRDAFLSKIEDQGTGFVLDKGKKGWRSLLHLDEKEQVRHLQLVIQNAAERGLAQFKTGAERELYRSVLQLLTEEGLPIKELRQEIMHLFTLADPPDFARLVGTYHLALRMNTWATHQTYTEADIVPSLSVFFHALIAELYADPLFHDRISDILKVRASSNIQQSMIEQVQATAGIQRSLMEMIATLREIYDTLENGYTVEQFEKDVEAYTEHIERTLRYIKLVGVVPKEHSNENRDPALNGIFVPLRIAMRAQSTIGEKDSIIDALEESFSLVLLGGPGFGKSTMARHLAWSHAMANLPGSTSPLHPSLLAGRPLPLRIELRRLNEDRKQHASYDFLSYVCEVLLGREGLKIPIQMFKTLLERRAMLVLFDGLDEVAMPNDRSILVSEIESFAQRYPGNRFLVTSRPVGYELTPLNAHIFAHGNIQPFNDAQIHQFLEHWYIYVLRDLSFDNQRELELLYNDLKMNTRLHSLAENPLLLTVITALHRYERLPDRRVLVYDKCADLLLETWARLKGTNMRWQDLILSKDDQYACVAHLGFVLHTTSQKSDTEKQKGFERTIVTDVSSRFILREIELFLQKQNLYTSQAILRTQAQRFLELIQEEAGLIVERGKDENGENLYGFVHRTFQEYFAAVDVLERYQQEEDANIISDFLRAHLYAPHWHEVVLLLFGKLKRKPATAQLSAILNGKVSNHLSKYDDILQLIQQDLFFVCSCLTEVVVENRLLLQIITHLGDLLRVSPFATQRQHASKAFGELAKIPQYTDEVRKQLKMLLAPNVITGISTRIDVMKTLYQSSDSEPEEQKRLVEALVELAQSDEVSFEQSVLAIEALYTISTSSNARFQAFRMFTDLLERPDLSPERIWQTSIAFTNVLAIGHAYEISMNGKSHLISYIPIHFKKFSDFSLEQIEHISIAFAEKSPDDSQKQYPEFQKLIKLARRPGISLKTIIFLAQILAQISSSDQERSEALQILMDLGQNPEISFKELVRVLDSLNDNLEHYNSFEFPIDKAVQLFLSLPERQGFFIESIEWPDLGYLEGIIPSIISNLTSRSDLSIEQTLLVALPINQPIGLRKSRYSQVELQPLIQMLYTLAQQPDLSIRYTILIAQALLHINENHSPEWQEATRTLMKLLHQPLLSFRETALAAKIHFMESDPDSEERTQYVQEFLKLADQPNLSFEQTLTLVDSLSLNPYSSDTAFKQQAIQILLELLERPGPSFEQITKALEDLYLLISVSEDKQRILQTLERMSQNQEFTVEQRIQLSAIPLMAYNNGYHDRIHALNMMSAIVQGEELKQYITKYWSSENNQALLSDIPYLAEFAMNTLLPLDIRDEIYQALQQRFPSFRSIEEAEE